MEDVWWHDYCCLQVRFVSDFFKKRPPRCAKPECADSEEPERKPSLQFVDSEHTNHYNRHPVWPRSLPITRYPTPPPPTPPPTAPTIPGGRVVVPFWVNHSPPICFSLPLDWARGFVLSETPPRFSWRQRPKRTRRRFALKAKTRKWRGGATPAEQSLTTSSCSFTRSHFGFLYRCRFCRASVWIFLRGAPLLPHELSSSDPSWGTPAQSRKRQILPETQSCSWSIKGEQNARRGHSILRFENK